MSAALPGLIPATLLVVGVILLIRYFVAGTRGTRDGGPQTPTELRLLSRVGIGPRQGVALLEAGERRFLVSCGDGGVRLLSELGRAGVDDEGRADPCPASVGQEATAGQHGALPRRARRGAGMRSAVGRCIRRSLPFLGVLGCALVPLVPEVGGLVAQGANGAEVQGGTLPLFELQLGGDEAEGGLRVTGPVGAVLLIGFLTLLPTLLLLMTSFTRILIVLHLLKQALGAQAAPPAHVLTALALLLSGFVMAPTLSEVNENALSPWMDGELDEVEMLQTASVPFREFMLMTTRDEDLALFLDLWGEPVPDDPEAFPLLVVASAFVTSELRAAFQMGFTLFLPFIVIDLVVASVLMSMGMFMLPPLMVSLPFKLLLFVLVDGWSLVVGSLVQSFR